MAPRAATPNSQLTEAAQLAGPRNYLRKGLDWDRRLFSFDVGFHCNLYNVFDLEYPKGRLSSGQGFICKAQVKPVRARPVCGGFCSF